MPRASVTRRVHFNAAHRVHNPDFPDDWNRNTFGVCNNPNYHGHNYELELTVEGEIDPATGYVLDLNILKELAQERLLRHLDHRNLNLDVDWFASSSRRRRTSPWCAGASSGPRCPTLSPCVSVRIVPRMAGADLELELLESPAKADVLAKLLQRDVVITSEV